MAMKNPVHPGAIVREDCLRALGLTVTEGATRLGVGRQTLSNLVNEKASVSIEMAYRLSHLQNSAFERDFAAVAVRLSWKSGPLSVPVGFRTTSTERAAPCRWERHYPDSGIAFKRIFQGKFVQAAGRRLSSGHGLCGSALLRGLRRGLAEHPVRSDGSGITVWAVRAVPSRFGGAPT